MSVHIKHQIIGPANDPQYVVVPYLEYLRMAGKAEDQTLIPHEVVELHITEGYSPLRAWRMFKKMTQKSVATRVGITQAAYSQMEKPESRPHAATLEKIANALDITTEQLTI